MSNLTSNDLIPQPSSTGLNKYLVCPGYSCLAERIVSKLVGTWGATHTLSYVQLYLNLVESTESEVRT